MSKLYSRRYNAPLTDKQHRQLFALLVDLQKEYEDFRRSCHVMESPLLYNTRMVLADVELKEE